MKKRFYVQELMDHVDLYLFGKQDKIYEECMKNKKEIKNE